MSRRAKVWCLVGMSVAGIGAFLVLLITRLRNHALAAAKVAVTTGTLVTAGGPFLAADKHTFMQLFVEKQIDQAKALFSKTRDEMTQAAQTRELNNLISFWLDAAQRGKLPQETRRAAIEYICSVYPASAVHNAQDMGSCCQLAKALWRENDPEAALQYSMTLLKRIKEASLTGDGQAQLALGNLLNSFVKIEPSDTRRLSARRTFAGACAETFPVGKTATEYVTVKLGSDLAVELLRSGPPDKGLDYFKNLLTWIVQSRQPDEPKVDFHVVTSRLFTDALALYGRERAEEVLVTAGTYAPDERLEVLWTKLFDAIPLHEQKQEYLVDLLSRYGSGALDAIGAALTESPQAMPVDQIIADHYRVIGWELSLGVEPRTLKHLVAELERRNANGEILRVTEFAWRTFPTEIVGCWAFDLWSKYAIGNAGEAALARASQEIIESFPTEPIADRARLALAKQFVERGETVQGLLMASPSSSEEESEKEVSLSASELRSLVDSYVKRVADSGTSINRFDVLVRLADQLRLAGEDEMSFEFYWEAAQRAPERFVDPQTSLPLDKEDCINGEPVVNNQAWVVFWNALAVDPDESRKTESMMEEFVTTYPDSRAAGLAHVFLAQSYETNNRRPEAIEQLKAIPDDLAGTRGVLSLYDKLATAVPPAIKKKYDESEAGEKDRISTLRTAIGNDPNAPNTDARITELAYLLTKQGEYAQAAVNYELLAVRYPDSPYCPRAIYTAQIIYRTKLNDEGHAARLVELLRTKYPDSRYASVLRG